MTAPGLVIFDCDGVLIDSEVIAARVFAECLVDAGFTITAEAALDLGCGKNAATLAEAVEGHFGRTLPDGFFPTMRAAAARAFEAELQPVAGVGELLQRSPLPRCVASNSHIDRVRHSLDVARLLPLFEPHVFSASMVARGKPAPDLFLLAAERLAVAPERCLVIEDSVGGVAAAQAAGMTAIGFCGGSHCREGHRGMLLAAGCERVFARMAELGEFLAASETRRENA